MLHLEGARSPEKRKGRELLTARSPYIEAALASLEIDADHIEEARRFGNKMQASVTRWRVGREVFSAPTSISKSEADRKLRQALRQQMGLGK